MSPIYFVPVLKLLDLCITCFTSTACLFLEWFNYKILLFPAIWNWSRKCQIPTCYLQPKRECDFTNLVK